MTGKKCPLLAVAAALALATAGCIHDDNDRPVTDLPLPVDGDGDEMPGDGDEMPGDGDEMPGDGNGEDERTMLGDPAALANIIDLVANNARRDEDGNYIGSSQWRQYSTVASEVIVSHTYLSGGSAGVAVWHDDNEDLQFSALIYRNQLLSTAPLAGSFRYINTVLDAQVHEGLTTSRRLVTNHDLGSDWQVTELLNVYDSIGTLRIHIATDLQHEDMATNPYDETYVQGQGNITLDGVPSLPVDQDSGWALILDNDTIRGSLDGVSGTFSCANSDGCWFVSDRTSPKFFAESDGVSFTPDGGTEQTVPVPALGSAVSSDWLAFGNWLYVPKDGSNEDAYDFGVFASGGDPFEVTNLGGLTGTATYEGKATGMYYTGISSESPAIGSFTADVELMADFGTISEYGTVGGEVNNFVFVDDMSSELPTSLELTTSAYEQYGVDPQGSQNVFDRSWPTESEAQPGGWIQGRTSASFGSETWGGHWSGAFFGNGVVPTDHPTSIAGTFGATNYNGSGLTGSFGAYRQ